MQTLGSNTGQYVTGQMSYVASAEASRAGTKEVRTIEKRQALGLLDV